MQKVFPRSTYSERNRATSGTQELQEDKVPLQRLRGHTQGKAPDHEGIREVSGCIGNRVSRSTAQQQIDLTQELQCNAMDKGMHAWDIDKIKFMYLRAEPKRRKNEHGMFLWSRARFDRDQRSGWRSDPFAGNLDWSRVMQTAHLILSSPWEWEALRR